ncbi:MAG: MFS transporter, partial [Leptospiraceae bacterium]|nr:MFS transporter [Leptospiraceae bacterium]
EQRGAVFALFNLTDDLGKGLGPFFVGLLLLVFDQVTAFNIAVAFWIPAGLIWLFLPKYIENDEKKVSQIIAARI